MNDAKIAAIIDSELLIQNPSVHVAILQTLREIRDLLEAK